MRAAAGTLSSCSAGALVGGIETADAFDLVVEQVETKRLRCARWKQVDDRAAHGELAGAQDLGDMSVAGVREALRAGRARSMRSPARSVECMSVDESARWQPIEQGGHAS